MASKVDKSDKEEPKAQAVTTPLAAASVSGTTSGDGEALRKLVIVDIPIDQCEMDPLNPNKETGEKFSTLVSMIADAGFLQPIVVRPVAQDRYRIVMGAHRWMAAKKLGYASVPAVVRADWSETDARTWMVKDNIVKGELDTEKFTALTRVLMQEDQLDYDLQAAMMGFDTTKEMLKFIEFSNKGKAKAEAAEAGGGEQMQPDAMIDLTATINEILTRYGKTLSQSYLSFPFGGQVHTMVEVDVDLKPLLDELLKVSDETKVGVTTLLVTILRDGIESVKPEYME